MRPQRTWLDATCPVYIDFGEELLVKLEICDESDLPCIGYVAKRKFLHDVMVETDARAVAAHLNSIASREAAAGACSGDV